MDRSELSNIIVKKCPCCGQEFSFHDILTQPFIEPKGITFMDNNPEMNMFLFNHVCDNCNTTFAIPAKEFSVFLKKDPPIQILTNLSKCEKHCLNIEDRNNCSQDCHWAPFRQFVIQLIEEKEKLKDIVVK